MENYFDNYKAKEKDKVKEPELTLEPNKLASQMESELTRIGDTRDAMARNIVPEQLSLFGDGDRDRGKIGEMQGMLMKEFRSIGERTPLGNKMKMLLSDSIRLNDFMMYSQGDLDKHIESLVFICKSAFKIIENMDAELKAKDTQIKLLEEGSIKDKKDIVGEDKGNPVRPPIAPLTEEERQAFTEATKERVRQYLELVKSGDRRGAAAKKGLVFILCRNEEQKEIANRVFNEMTAGQPIIFQTGIAVEKKEIAEAQTNLQPQNPTS